MNTTRATFVVALLALAVTAGTAGAGFTPAWSYLPAPLRAQLAAKEGGSLFLPARTPLFYRYRSGAKVTGGVLAVPFTNRVRVSEGVWKWTNKTFIWNVRKLPAGTDCTAWKTRDKTLQLSGNKVYWSGADNLAWRCVTDSSGRPLVVSAPYGDAVASALDVSHRTSPYTIALTVTPGNVRHGGTVLVRGVAGDCTSGDAVTIISHAFSAAHSFAGVPAVFAQVGSAGRFSVKTRIPATRAAGTYVITARCGGGNLGVQAHLKVTT